jgi:hypothetical protein
MRSSDLSRALLSPPISSVDEPCRTHLRHRLSAAIAPLVEQLPPGDQVVVDLSLLRTARTHPEWMTREEVAFIWKPVFVRRSLGLAVVDACVSGRFRSPAEAVGPVASEAVSEWERTGWRTFHWEPWLAGLDTGARALVLAEAVSWATGLWLSFDWTLFDRPPRLGGADDQWICPAARTVRLKGRSELRVPLATSPVPTGSTVAGQATTPVALASVSSGRPSDDWATQLAFLALVASLRSPSRPVPARVAGLWPDAGIRLLADIDGPSLVAAADQVVATVSAVVDSRLAVKGRA